VIEFAPPLTLVTEHRQTLPAHSQDCWRDRPDGAGTQNRRHETQRSHAAHPLAPSSCPQSCTADQRGLNAAYLHLNLTWVHVRNEGQIVHGIVDDDLARPPAQYTQRRSTRLRVHRCRHALLLAAQRGTVVWQISRRR